MSDWTAGYVADIGYTHGYYAELNPLRVKLAFLNAGLVPPKVGTACELGFGQGLSVNLHAAASVTQWHGTDFNPSQAGFALELAEAAGAGAHLFDEAFAEFAGRSDLPDFDFIGLHGIWSWISDANRGVIVDFIRRKLKVGGVVYIGYNTQPGWAAFAPMRHLLSEHAEVIGAPGHGIVRRIDGALDFAAKLLATNPLYARANPQIAERIKLMAGQNRHYLAHEYFNSDWLPMHFGTVARWLAPAKLEYACSAQYLDNVDAINLTAEQQALLREIPDAPLRETVRDFIRNQQFRRDYWVRGARRLSAREQAEAIRDQSVLLVVPRPDVSLQIKGGLGDVQLTESIYGPILDVLADHKTHTLGEINSAVANSGVKFADVFQSILILAGVGPVVSAQDTATVGQVRKYTDKLNAHLIGKALGSGDLSYLASPVTGGGIAVGRIPQLLLLAKLQGNEQPSQWVDFVWKIIGQQGQKLIKEGKTLETEAENRAELKAQAGVFAEKTLPMLKALQIA
jgi:hypothetical protein